MSRRSVNGSAGNADDGSAIHSGNEHNAVETASLPSSRGIVEDDIDGLMVIADGQAAMLPGSASAQVLDNGQEQHSSVDFHSIAPLAPQSSKIPQVALSPGRQTLQGLHGPSHAAFSKAKRLNVPGLSISVEESVRMSLTPSGKTSAADGTLAVLANHDDSGKGAAQQRRSQRRSARLEVERLLQDLPLGVCLVSSAFANAH